MATLLGRENTATEYSMEAEDREMLGTVEEFTLKYLVQATSGDDYGSIITAGGLPSLRQQVGLATCTGKRAEEIDYRLWRVSCTFSTLGSKSDDGSGQGLSAIDLDWSVEELEEVVTRDTEEIHPISGKLKIIQNSVNEPLITTINKPIPVLTIRRLEINFNPNTILEYCSHVNSETFWDAPPKCALMWGPTAKEKEVEGTTLWDVTYIIKFNMLKNPDTGEPRGWVRYLLLQGTKHRKVAGGPIKPYLLNGVPTTCNLNRDGTVNTGEPLYDDWNVYESIDFNNLNLGP